MRFEQLRYLEASLRTGSFRQAAKELGVAQPTITAQVQRLEEDLGVVLVVRSAHGVRPTHAAEMILPHALAALRIEAAMRQEASSVDSLKVGNVKLAAVSSATQTILPDIIGQLHKEYPKIRFEVTEGGSEVVIRGVVSGDFDAGVLVRVKSEAPDPTHLDHIDLLEGRLVLMIPENHPLAHKEFIDAQDLEGQPIVNYQRGGLLRPLFDRFLEGVDTIPVYFTDNAETSHRMVRAGVGIGIGNTLAPSTQSGNGVVLRPIREPWTETRMSVVVRKDEMRSPIVQTMLKLFKQGADAIRLRDQTTPLNA